MTPDVRSLIVELAKRRPVVAESQRDEAAEVAAKLRNFFYPKQRAFFTSKAKRRATKKTRRSGATTGGCHEFIARAVEQAGWRGTYVTTTRKEARERAWLSDTANGLLDVLRRHGTTIDHPSCECIIIGGVTAYIRDQAMTIDFSNGSKIDLFGADDERSLRKQRGLSKHVYWVDEAQDFRFLEKFYDAVILGSLTDYDGECWLSGTPGPDCVGMFYEATKDDAADGPTLAGWETHSIAVVDNPYFGHVIGDDSSGWLQYFVEDNAEPPNRYGPYTSYFEAEKAATQIRWDRTAGKALKDKNWKGDEPDFVREWLGRWSKVDARYVYPVHICNPFELLYTSSRFMDNPLKGSHPRFDDHPRWPNIPRAIQDLPKMPRFNKKRQWMYAIGADFGYHPDPFALVVWAFAHDTQDVYELFSWKATKVHTDDQGLYMQMVWQALDNVVVFVGDPAGKQDDFEVWRTRMGLPIDEANKRGKNTLEEFLADDIRRGRIHLRHDSPLYDEMKHLLYLPTKPGKTREVAKHRRSGDNIVHGDHCCLTAGHLVTTETGEQPIESIALGTLVPTRAGLRPVVAAFPTGEKPTWLVTLSDGSSLTGTADHPVFTENGWTDLAKLTPGDTLTTCTTDHRKSSFSTVIGIADTLSVKNALIVSTSAERAKSEASLSSSIYIEPFGKRFTDRCRKVITSITGTKIRSTTQSTTSSASSAASTSASTDPSRSTSLRLASISTQLESTPKHGMAQKQDSRGTESTVAKLSVRDLLSDSYVSAARLPSKPRTETPSSAGTTVKPPHDEHLASTTKTGNARSAAVSFAATSTRSASAAPVCVLRVEPTGKTEMVYNLTVADQHEYFANGVLVSNCDAARYAYEALTHYMSVTPATNPRPGSHEALVQEGVRHEKKIDDGERRRAEQLAEADDEMYDSRSYGYGE